MHLPLRWVSILSGLSRSPGSADSPGKRGRTLNFGDNFSFSASTGIHTGTDAAKMVLAGANVVQLASILYLKGTGYLQTMIEDFSGCLENAGIPSAREAKGRLAQSDTYKPETLERLQYVKVLSENNHK